MAEHRVHLHLNRWLRQSIVDMHLAYASGFSDKLFPTLDDINAEADAAANQFWETARDRPYDESVCAGSIADAAECAGQEVYSNLTFVREQLISLSIAGLYHLFERTLKDFIIKEIRHYVSSDHKTIKDIQKANFEEIIQFLAEFGHNLKSHKNFSMLNELRLIANVVKHGDGQACNCCQYVLGSISRVSVLTKVKLKGFSVSYDSIEITANRQESENYRIVRLHRVVGYIAALDEQRTDLKLGERILRLHDHKGILNVQWKVDPSQEMKNAILAGWLSGIGDGSDNIEHVVFPKLIEE